MNWNWIALLSLLAPAACRPDTSPDTRPTPPPASVSSASQSASPALPSGSASGTLVPMPTPARRRLEAAVAQNATCESCHPIETAQWKASRHRQSNTNHAFELGYSFEPRAFCRDCHAPEADPNKPLSQALSTMGISCVTCHVTEEGFVLAGASPKDRSASSAAEAAHPLRRSAEFSRSPGCSACHEFRFPGKWGLHEGDFMQTTIREHDDSPTSSVPCAACHMPVEQERRSHRFSQVRDRTWLQQRLQVKAEQTSAGLVLSLSQPQGGHGFPTGDVFRRLEIGCEWRDSEGKAIGRQVRYLTRHFGTEYGTWQLQLKDDDRVFYEPRVVEFKSPAQSAASASWWVSLQRVVMPSSRDNGEGGNIESEVKIHSGITPWQPK